MLVQYNMAVQCSMAKSPTVVWQHGSMAIWQYGNAVWSATRPWACMARNLRRLAAVQIRNLLGGPIQTFVQKQGIVKNEEQSVEKLLG